MEVKERICKLGEKHMWFAPKRLRGKLDQIYKYGTFLGRAMASDQNCIGLQNGDVIRARAIIRLVPAARWDSKLALSVKTTPLTESTRYLDATEALEQPHQHPDIDEGREAPRSSPQLRMVKIALKDRKAHGYSDHCPRCQCRGDNMQRRARFHNHTESCRRTIYDCLAKAGAAEVQQTSEARLRTNDPESKEHSQHAAEALSLDLSKPGASTPAAETIDHDIFDGDANDLHEVVNADIDKRENATELLNKILPCDQDVVSDLDEDEAPQEEPQPSPGLAPCTYRKTCTTRSRGSVK